MDIADYLAIIKRNLAVIISCVILFVAAALLVTWQRPVSYQSSVAVEVTRYQLQSQAEVSYFQYDNFYNTQVATTFANNLVGWAAAPSIVAQTYKDAGYELPNVGLRDLGKTFTAKKKTDGSSVVDINYTSQDSQKAQKMIITLSDVLKEKIEKSNSADASARFSVLTSDPVVIANPKTYALNSIIAGLFGLFIAVSFSFLRESLKK